MSSRAYIRITNTALHDILKLPENYQIKGTRDDLDTEITTFYVESCELPAEYKGEVIPRYVRGLSKSLLLHRMEIPFTLGPGD